MEPYALSMQSISFWPNAIPNAIWGRHFDRSTHPHECCPLKGLKTTLVLWIEWLNPHSSKISSHMPLPVSQ
jgi:hypothetical protein